MDVLTYWYLFPVATVIATTAMFFGIGGAVLFSPFFLLVLSLRVDVAIALGLLIEVFGFSSGFVGFARNGLINYHLGSRILPLTIIFAVAGAAIGKYIPAIALELTLAMLLLLLAAAFLRKESGITPSNTPLHPDESHDTINRRRYDFWQDFKKSPGLFLRSSLGGLMVGLVSAGLGEINGYNFVKKLGMAPGLAAGTSVFIVAVTAFSASVFNLSYFNMSGAQDIDTIWRIALFAVPGVIIGAQLGVILSRKIDRAKIAGVLPWFLAILGLLTILKTV